MQDMLIPVVRRGLSQTIILITKGDYQYYDTWLGGEKFSGEEAIWKKGKSNLFDELFWKNPGREIQR